MKKIFVLVSVVFSPLALGWGKVGHEAIAILARKNLSVVANKKITQLLGTDDLRESSTWPDAIRGRSEWQHSKPFHFTGVQDKSTYLDSLKLSTPDEVSKGDALRAILRAEDILRNSKSSDQQKIFALKFLVHIVGDIHQPLHTGRPEDKGGNAVSITWFGKKSNLHSVWDSGIISSKMEATPGHRPELSENAEYYLSLLTPPTKGEVEIWIKGEYLDWHDEAFAIRPKSYQSVIMLNSEVVKTYKDLVDQQVQKAGYRLSVVLNSIFEGQPLSPKGIQLRKQISGIIGSGSRLEMEPTKDTNLKSNYSEFDHICDHE